MPKTFRNIEEFYDEQPERRYSPEADYGSHWTTTERRRYRISYIQDTGEIYALELSGHDGPITLLGQVPADPVTDPRTDLYYRTLDAVLAEWPEQALNRQGPEWVKQQLAEAGYTVFE